MRLGLLTFCRDLQEVPRLAAAAEAAGCDFLAFADSPGLAHDPFLGALLAARSSERLRVGVGVVNPLTRHPALLANLAVALAVAGGAGSILGMGTGNGGVRYMGGRPSTVSELVGALTAVRDAMARRVRTLPDDERAQKRQAKLVVAGSGPQVLGAAGELADEVWMNVGVRTTDLSTGLGWVAEGARRGEGRQEHDVWTFCIGSIDTTAGRARHAARPGAAALARYVLEGDLRRGSLDDDLRGRVEELLVRYRYDSHLEPGDSANGVLCEELGLGEYTLSRFALAGTVGSCAEALGRIAGSGVDGICVSLSAAEDPVRQAELWGEALGRLGRG